LDSRFQGNAKIHPPDERNGAGSVQAHGCRDKFVVNGEHSPTTPDVQDVGQRTRARAIREIKWRKRITLYQIKVKWDNLMCRVYASPIGEELNFV
jgi:hypothetical protein